MSTDLLDFVTTFKDGAGNDITLHLEPTMGAVQVNIQTEQGRIMLDEAALKSVNEYVQRYAVALHAMRGTQP